MRLIFVTQNKNKLADAQKLMPEFEIDHVDFDVPEIQSLSIKEIAKSKIEIAFSRTNSPCFVMDAGLEIQCLGNFPGPLVKWFYKTVGAEKICKIANTLGEKDCKWTTVLAYFDGENIHYFEESVNGTIPESPRGTNGYDWDVIFIPSEESRTFAEMTFDEKQQYAVTKKLLTTFGQFLKGE